MPQVILSTTCCSSYHYRGVVHYGNAGRTRVIVSVSVCSRTGVVPRLTEQQAQLFLVPGAIYRSDSALFAAIGRAFQRTDDGHTWRIVARLPRARGLRAIADDASFDYSGGVVRRFADDEHPAWENESEEDDNRSSDIHDYSYKPTPRYRRAAGERVEDGSAKTRAYFGVELEIDADSPKNYDAVPGQADPLFYCKTDGSLNYGLELVSHPGTEAWWREQTGAVTALLNRLRRDGWKSHDVGTCGIHVHISRRAFEGTLHLYRFLHLIYRSPRLTLQISQRTPDKLKQWASLTPSRRKALKRKIGINYQDDSRYEAVNMSGSTAEVRIFRGTLLPDRFYKNLEYLWAALAFTSETTRVRACSASNFLAWVHARKEQYPNLANFTKKEYAQFALPIERAAV